jgi:hypothetical protein
MPHYKVICVGHIIEVWKYQHEINSNPNQNKSKESEMQTMYLLTGDITYLDKMKRPEWLEAYIRAKQTKRNKAASKANFRRIVLMNFRDKSNFITLTFRDGATFPDGEEIDIKDIEQCNKYFDQFMKRLRRAYGNFKYAVTIEFQDKNGRGAVHYHVLADLKMQGYKNGSQLMRKSEREFDEKYWQAGFVSIKDIKDNDNVGAYMTKYMVKKFDDERLKQKKAYRFSQNMDRPLVLKGEEAEAIIKLYELEQKKEVFANCYGSEYLGEISYKEYNLNRLESEE